MKIGDWIVARLNEPSTWRGVIGLIGGFGVVISPDQATKIIAAAIAIIGAINVFRKEPTVPPSA